MPDLFPTDLPPFHVLGATELARLQEAAQLAHFAPGQLLNPPEQPCDTLWVMSSGHVQWEEAGHTHVLETGESTGWRALLTGHCQATLTALDAVSAWPLPKAMLLALLADNARFANLVFTEVAGNLANDAQGDQHREMVSHLRVHLRDAPLQTPPYVAGTDNLITVCQRMQEGRTNFVLVRDTTQEGERIGIFTTTDLRDALLKNRAPGAIAARDVSRFDLISLDAQAELDEALLTMVRHRVHRVVVRDGEQLLGVLSQLDLMGAMSNQSHLITLQVEQAQDVQALGLAARAVDESLKVLQRSGMHIEVISRLVSELNSQIFAKLWAFLAPPDWQANSCLLVMGSEGRGEQLLKTDQDNALLLRDDVDFTGIEAVAERFSAALSSFGYPPCPGQIMVTNPLWRQPLAEFRATLGQWLFGGQAEGHMNLAIFLDARAVAGDASLLHDAREHALKLVRGSDTFIGRLASAIDQFPEPPSGWWARLTHLQVREAETFDLKKIGTFPIVHGARALALEYRLDCLGTAERLQALAQQERLPAALVRDLVETLHLLMGLKLRNNLRQRALGEPVSNLVHLSSLGTLDRDLLKDALVIIRQFKQHLRVHYRLGS